ncbi:toxin-antitoxin system YwqK family antitoxin [uncultured Helicobacter sp.]|uniref:toxin-antitoxin system YwqK family antitoxin n=1 Tax=uncultured Helicobacter sp. TaxID=175537 RepID=UPI002631FB3D|nr:toxin-antitoxin system YwqK family antitoxin [uncultured Helicobacter sp.]
MRIVRYIGCLIAAALWAQESLEYDLRISYTGDKNAPTTIKTQYCKGTTTKCGKQIKISHNGVLLFKAYYKNGEYDGEVLSYYPNGTLHESRVYIEGKEIGKRVTYHRNGKIQSEQMYSLNKREGEGNKYYEDGVLQAHFTFKNDRLDGVRKEFDKKGILIYETLYKDGKKQSMKQYNTQGEVIESKNCRWQACY